MNSGFVVLFLFIGHVEGNLLQTEFVLYDGLAFDEELQIWNKTAPRSKSECGLLCLNDDRCVSFDAARDGNGDIKSCVFFPKINSPLVAKPGTTHFHDNNVVECWKGTCLNGASCIDLEEGVNCACTDGFAGSHCEIDVDECASQPCQNGGTCTDEIAGYQCSCPSDVLGDHCEKKFYTAGDMKVYFSKDFAEYDDASLACQSLIPGSTFLVEFHSEAQWNSLLAAWQAAKIEGNANDKAYWIGAKDPHNDSNRLVWDRSNVEFAYHPAFLSGPTTNQGCILADTFNTQKVNDYYCSGGSIPVTYVCQEI